MKFIQAKKKNWHKKGVNEASMFQYKPNLHNVKANLTAEETSSPAEFHSTVARTGLTGCYSNGFVCHVFP